MTHSPDAAGVEPEPDLEYDLAHEPGVTADPARADQPPAVRVATETADYDGDYGYDLAHDIPKE